ncbi:hypothetical protein [Bacillus sp. CGMCC 1.60114]|uniref:hypothetical protein n=1 Tax=unclassified Bacillus (in: firmicutes) TaxID=185979 RepID=UPI003670A9D3
MDVYLIHERTRQLKVAKVGFSWTVLFFSFFSPFFRGDWKWGLILLILSIFLPFLSAFVFAFIYNRIYINDLLQQGYKPNDEISEEILIEEIFIN